MSRPGITYEEVVAVAQSMEAEGIHPGLMIVYERLGSRSISTINKHLKKWRESRPAPAPAPIKIPQELINAVKDEINKAASKAASQEPVAWRFWLKDLQRWSYSSTHHGCGEPLYAHPMPSCQGLLDSSITPLAQRKIQTLLDKGEYRAIENATVLVNGQGHAAIVNRGGAFYWVDNEALAREFDGVGVVVDSHHIADKRKMVADMYWINPDYPSSDSIIEAFEPITTSVEVNVGDRYEVSRAIRLPDMMIEVTELEENGDVKAYKVVGGDHIPDGGKMVDDADESLRDALDLVGLDISAYSSPKEALEALIDWHVSVATNSRTNGGWQLVPVEPTEEMLDAACLTNGTSGDRYKAMLAAAPNSARSRNRI